MQWLIDIIKAWIVEQGYLTTAFVDRGDADSADFDLFSLTTDNNWHDLDLSGIVPAGAKAVLVTVVLLSATASTSLTLRKKGNTLEVNVARMTTTVANLTHIADLACPISTTRFIQYNILDIPWTFLSLSVKGWIL